MNEEQLRIASLQLEHDVLFDFVQQIGCVGRTCGPETSSALDMKGLSSGDRVVEIGSRSS